MRAVPLIPMASRPPVYEGEGPWLPELVGLLSRALNFATGGKGGARVTFSARTGWEAMQGRSLARAALIDRLTREPGHCATWARWHMARALLPVPELEGVEPCSASPR